MIIFCLLGKTIAVFSFINVSIVILFQNLGLRGIINRVTTHVLQVFTIISIEYYTRTVICVKITVELSTIKAKPQELNHANRVRYVIIYVMYVHNNVMYDNVKKINFKTTIPTSSHKKKTVLTHN